MSLKDLDLNSFVAKLNDLFDMEQQKTNNIERRNFAKEINKDLVAKDLTKAFVGRLVVDILNLTSKSQYEKYFPDWAKINASGIFVAALIGDLLEIEKATKQVREKVQTKKLNLDIRLEESDDVDSIVNFMSVYDPKFERISTTVGKKIPEEKVGELVVAIKGLTHPVKYVIFQAIRFPTITLFDEIIGKATNRLQIFYTHKIADEEYVQVTAHIQQKMNELDLPGQANVYTVTNHKKRYELLRKQVEDSSSSRVLEPSAFGEHIKTIDLRKHIPDDVLDQLQANIPEDVKLYLWMSTEKEVQNFYRLVTKVSVEIDLMQIFLDKESKTKDFIKNSLIFECLKQKNAKFVTLTICSIESRDLFLDHVKNILPQVTNKLDLRTNIKFTPEEQSSLKEQFTSLMAVRPHWQKLELHFIGKQHVIYGMVTDENKLKEITHEEQNNRRTEDKTVPDIKTNEEPTTSDNADQEEPKQKSGEVEQKEAEEEGDVSVDDDNSEDYQSNFPGQENKEDKTETPEAIAEQEPVTEESQVQEPIVEEISEQEPVTEEAPEQEPQVEEVPEQEPVTEEAPEQEPQVEEVSEQEPVTEETPEQEPQVEEVSEQEPVTEEAPEQEPQVEEVSEQEPVTEETPEQEPQVEEVSEQEPVTEEAPEQEPQVEEVVEQEPVTEETTGQVGEVIQFYQPEAEQKSVTEVAPEEEPQADEVSEQEPEAEETPDQKPVTEEAEESPKQETEEEEPQKEETDVAKNQSPDEDNVQDEPQTGQDAEEEPQAEINAEESKAEEESNAEEKPVAEESTQEELWVSAENYVVKNVKLTLYAEY